MKAKVIVAQATIEWRSVLRTGGYGDEVFSDKDLHKPA